MVVPWSDLFCHQLSVIHFLEQWIVKKEGSAFVFLLVFLFVMFLSFTTLPMHKWLMFGKSFLIFGHFNFQDQRKINPIYSRPWYYCHLRVSKFRSSLFAVIIFEFASTMFWSSPFTPLRMSFEKAFLVSLLPFWAWTLVNHSFLSFLSFCRRRVLIGATFLEYTDFGSNFFDTKPHATYCISVSTLVTFLSIFS